MAFTYFFRDLQTLEMIRDLALPSLRTRKYIRIWDAGCAHGAEPYSLAMILRENMGHFQFRNVTIDATDIDGSNLFGDIIAKGIYPKEELQRIPGDIFNKYFEPVAGNGDYKIIDDIRKSIEFRKHDLLSLKPLRDGYGLILCKNVLLHFGDKERINVIKMFYKALAKGGYFITEQTQKLPQQVQDLFEQVTPKAQVWRKADIPG